MDTRGDFLKYDKQVLRFYGYWDDTDNLYGVVHDLEIYYYLADNTMEIKENLPSNSGRDSGSTFLRRMQVPKVRIRCTGICANAEFLPNTVLRE